MQTSKNLLQIDVINEKYQTSEDLINIRFKNEDSLQVSFSKLVSQSKYIRDTYKYTELVDSIQIEIEEIESRMNISEGSIGLFLQLIQNGRASIGIERYKDFYALSEYFITPNLKRALDDIRESRLLKDINFSIEMLLSSASANDTVETELASKLEHFLSGRVNQCIKHARFGELPTATIYRVFAQGSEECINHDMLLDFILASVETRFILLKFIVLHRLSDDKLSTLFSFIGHQEDEVRKQYIGYIQLDPVLINKMKQKCDESVRCMKKTKEQLKNVEMKYEKTKKELKDEEMKHNDTKEQLNEERLKHEMTKKELIEEGKKHNDTKEQLKEEKLKHEKAKEELKEEEMEHEKTKEKLNEEKVKHEETRKELIISKSRFKLAEDEINQIKSGKQIFQAIMVGGCNEGGGLGSKSNNKSQNGSPTIYPPAYLALDPSSLLSYSVNYCHSVAVTKGGKLLGAGEKRRISSTIPDNESQFTEFCIKDNNGCQLNPISAVCTGAGTLYILSKSDGIGRYLVLFDADIKGRKEVFLNIGMHEPLALFGGADHAAVICEKGEVIFINRDAIKKSPGSFIEASLLPDGERASSIACCKDSIFALSASGRVFESDVEVKSCILHFTEVAELSGEEIVCVSGAYEHCVAINKEGRVFGRGSNSHGALGLGERISKISSFTLIPSLSDHEIIAAYAGSWHTLFKTREGKIISCGWNYYGQLLHRGEYGNDFHLPAESVIAGGATFCIAGGGISAFFVGFHPPLNTPNRRIEWSI